MPDQTPRPATTPASRDARVDAANPERRTSGPPPRRPRIGRVAATVVLVVVLALVLTLAVAAVLVRRPLPQTEGVIGVSGLSGEVEVVRDEHGVPQIYADTSEDLWRAQGWVTASERFFQMDVRRHVAAGRLAELLGESAVPGDTLARTLGWQRTARQELGLVQPETRTALAAYAAGVNAYVDQHGTTELAVEYTLLGLDGTGYQPEPWSEVDSLGWLKTVSWELGGGLDAEVERALTTASLGPAVAADLYPGDGEDVADPIVQQGAVVDGVYEQDAERGGTRNPRRPPPGWARRPRPGSAPTAEPPGASVLSPAALELLARTRLALADLPSWVAKGAGRGSNAWAVAGEHTTTGAPLLANDPHLDATLPGTWLQVGLHCRVVSPRCPYDVSGATLPGVPGVVIGHNADVAWGMTSLGADVTDLFVERVDEATYRYDGRALPLRRRAETIEVAEAPDVEIVVRSTRHGPLLSDAVARLAALADGTVLEGRGDTPLEEGAATGSRTPALAVQWTGLRPTATADAVLALDRARGWEGFRSALADFALPAQGFVYADTAGRVGFQAAGRIPLRKSGNDGVLPVAGWRPENDWTRSPLPFDGLPSVLDPDGGVVVSANQSVADARYPYLLTTSPDPGYRAARISSALSRWLAGGGRVSPEQIADLQGDDHDPTAALLVPRLLDVELPEGYASDGQRLLAEWDLEQASDSPAAAYFNATWRALLAQTFRDELPEGLRPRGGARWVAVVASLLDEPSSPWWDDLGTDGVREDRDDVLASALLQARDDLTRLQAVDPDDWAWGRGHTLDLVAQPVERWRNPVVRELLDRTGTAVGGGSVAVDATDWDAATAVDPWAVTTAPTLRMVVDLADLDASRWVSLAGVSGHPASRHYGDQIDPWAAHRTLAWPFTAAAVDDAGTDRLVLRSE